MSTTTAAATTSTTTAVAAATSMPRREHGDRQQNATEYDRQNSPHRTNLYAPMYRAYKLRATPMSVVPLIMARPSGKIVNK